MLKHVSFITQNPDAVLAFYTALGATTRKDLITAEGHRRLVLDFAGSAPSEGGTLQFFALNAPEQPQSGAGIPHWAEHIALRVTDLPSTVARLRAQGVSVTRDIQPSPSGTPMAFVLDPDGRQVELLEA